MATVYVTYGKVGKRTENGILSAFIAGTTRSETITSSGTTAPGSLTATDGDVCYVECDTRVAVVAGSGTPTATIATGAIAGPTGVAIVGMNAGDKIAVIDV